MPSLTKRKRQFQKCHRHAITRRFQSMKTAEVEAEAEAEFDFFLKIVSELYIDDDNDFEHEMSEIDDEDVEIDLLTLNIEEKLSLIKESFENSDKIQRNVNEVLDGRRSNEIEYIAFGQSCRSIQRRKKRQRDLERIGCTNGSTIYDYCSIERPDVYKTVPINSDDLVVDDSGNNTEDEFSPVLEDKIKFSLSEIKKEKVYKTSQCTARSSGLYKKRLRDIFGKEAK